MPMSNPCLSIVGFRKTSLTASVRVLIALLGVLCDSSKCNGSSVAFVQSVLLVLKPAPCGCASHRWSCGLSPASQADRGHCNPSLWTVVASPVPQRGAIALCWPGWQELQPRYQRGDAASAGGAGRSWPGPAGTALARRAELQKLPPQRNAALLPRGQQCHSAQAAAA